MKIEDLLRMAWKDGRRYGQGNTDLNFNDHINSTEYKEAIKLVKNNDSLHGVSGSLQADIRNKLSPAANLVAMLEDNAPQEYIDKEMKAVKKSIDYLSNYR